LELQRALERSLLGGPNGAGAAIDLSSLHLLEGKVCWVLYIDTLVLSSDGNLLDALSIAIKVCLIIAFPPFSVLFSLTASCNLSSSCPLY
jgi:exosome complex RNA-binding protein Rrp42 (RNase PH superfamily)